MSRRKAVGSMLAGAAAVALGAATNVRAGEGAKPVGQPKSKRQPLVFLPHGGGPYSYVEFGAPQHEVDELVRYWQAVGRLGPERPKAILMISAHWEEAVPTVMTSPAPTMLYDYYGFPAASYEITWSAPGSPELAQRIRGLLQGAGMSTAGNADRGFDHGTFIPMGRVFPNADVPCVQLSLKKGLDPEEHLAMGRALAPLRDEGVLIIGSGMSYHDLRGFRSRQADQDAMDFDAWLQAAVTAAPAERSRLLAAWEKAPSARACHPREEHLLPLMVVAGAAGEDRGTVPYRGTIFGKVVSAVHFG